MNDFRNKKVYLAGHTGMVGSAILRELESRGYKNIIYKDFSELDLRNQSEVQKFYQDTQPELVIIAAAKVGGILANNTYRAEFLYDNLMIEANIIEAARQYGTQKLLLLGSSTIYPKMAPQPMKEEYLQTGPLEPTHEPYAIAKIAGIKLCDTYRAQYGCHFISAIPTNLYGPNDNFHPQNSHVVPGLIRKFHEAKKNNEPFVTIWGTGAQRRELLHVDDLADACFFLMHHFDEPGFINVGVGQDISILELAQLVQRIVGYRGEIRHDLEKPDGAPRKLLDVSKLKNLGWEPKIDLEEGIQGVYEGVKDIL